MTVALATSSDVEAITGADAPAGTDRLIEMASATVERFCRRSFRYYEDEEITVRVTDGTLRLPNDPILEVSSIETPSGATLAVGTYDAHTDGTIHLGRTYWDDELYPGRWASGVYTLVVTGGYETTPDDVVAVVAGMVARHLAISPGRTSVSLGQFSESFTPDVGAGLFLTPADMAALRAYRRSITAVRVAR